jgi:hypothetical protein
MAKETKTIKINGQPYDTSTGEAVTVNVKTSKKAVIVPARPAGAPKPVMDVKRTAPHHAKAHQPESGKTLMRKAVKKPTPQKSPITSKSKQARSVPVTIVDTKPPVNSAKLKNAQAVPQSQLISHFGTTTIVPVANHPHAVKPVLPQPAAVIDIKPRPVVISEAEQPIDIFQNALMQATAHEQPKHKDKKTKRRSGRALRLVTSSFAVLLLAGFIGYQNMAQINIRVAAKKAGFAATLPSYKPAGFSVGAFHYSPGVVNVSFHSNSDKRSFALSEKPTKWDDQTLREDYVASAAGNSYEVVQTAGRVIYVYGQNATWLNNGIWYNVQTNGSLSSHQLIQLAASI